MTSLRQCMPVSRSDDGGDGLRIDRRIPAVVAISLGTMVTSIDNGSMSLALPTLARDLHVKPSEAVMVVTIFQLVLIMTLLPLSALGQRLGYRRLYQSGLALFMASTMLCFFARSLTFLMCVRACQALGAAATFSVSAALIRAIYPKARLGSGLALNTIVASTSASIAPSFGGLMLSIAEWPWLFAATVPLAALSLMAGRSALPEPAVTTGTYDFGGALQCAVMFGMGVVAMELIVHGMSPIPIVMLSLGAFGIGFMFVRRERYKDDPMLPVDLLGRKPIALAAFAGLLVNLAAMTLQMTLPFRLQQTYGFTPGQAGLVLAAWPIATMVAAPTAGILSDRVRPGWLCIIGMTIGCCGLVALASLPAQSAATTDIVWRIALTATGFGLFYSPNARFVIGSTPPRRTAAAGALTQMTRMAGQILGSTIAAAFFALNAGAGSVSAIFGAILALVGVWLSAATLRRREAGARTYEDA